MRRYAHAEAAAHKINRLLGRSGKVCQTEPFDHVLRSSESLREKVADILDNPVRKGLVPARANYRWLWHRDLGSPLKPTQSFAASSTEGEPPSAVPTWILF
jgi:hypothetical protein